MVGCSGSVKFSWGVGGCGEFCGVVVNCGRLWWAMGGGMGKF